MNEASLQGALKVARQGDVLALSGLLTRAENFEIAMEDLDPSRRSGMIIGFTGAPGVGKSTLISCLISEYRRRDFRVAVLCFDPSSPVTGGALLGDRIRMQNHAADSGVYVRSLSSRGHLGGLSSTAEVLVSILSQVGFDIILIETVGVGQSEVEIASISDRTVVVLSPGTGDGIQMAKAGILEIADVYVVNKADSVDVDIVLRDLRAMVALGTRDVPVVTTIAGQGQGASEVIAALGVEVNTILAKGKNEH